MLANMIAKYHCWEDQVLEALRDPSSVDRLPPHAHLKGLRKLASLTPIERNQLYAFCSVYRGWKGTALMLKAIAVLSLLGVALSLLAPSKMGLFEWLMMTNSVGLVIIMALVGIWFNYRRAVRHQFKAALLCVAGMYAGAALGVLTDVAINGKPLLAAVERTAPKIVPLGLAAGAAYLIMVLVVSAWRNKDYEAIAARLQAEAEHERLARQLSESQLRLLRAQIEPHFLFNTLGAVQQLAEKEAPRAAELTSHLIAFLRVSTAEMSAEQSTLAAEFSLIRSYLEVMRIRLGSRLRFDLQLPAELAQHPIPGMALLTLVENAIKHGVEPSLRGASISVAAAIEDGELRIAVRDTGVGLSPEPGSGIGLHNVKERLRLAYGPGASLALYEEEDGGVVADIRIPQLHQPARKEPA